MVIAYFNREFVIDLSGHFLYVFLIWNRLLIRFISQNVSTDIRKSADPMRHERLKWNLKYRQGRYSGRPADVVARFYGLAPGKKALDIAAGDGRNAIFLAQNGFSVEAVDIAEVGLAAFSGKYSNIQAICADLDQFDIPADRYDLILNIKFLNRRLFPSILEGLKPGGILIFNTLLKPEKTTAPSHYCRDYLLRTNELLHAFLGLRIVYYREGPDSEADGTDRTASLVGVKV